MVLYSLTIYCISVVELNEISLHGHTSTIALPTNLVRFFCFSDRVMCSF